MSEAEKYALRHQSMRRTDFLVEQKLTGSRRLGMVRVSQQGVEFGDPPSDAYLLTAPLFGAPYVECDFSGFGIKQRTYAGDYVIQPLDGGAIGFADSSVTVQMTVFDGSWFRTLLEEVSEGRRVDLEPAAVRSWRNGRLDVLLHKTWAVIGSQGDQSQAWIDDASLKIIHTVAGQTGIKPQPVPLKPLSRAQFGRVHDLVEANLHDGIGVKEMASAAGVSLFHFSRRFRATRGESPHQFLMSRRLSRARQLIAETNLSLSAISAMVGYSSQAHMSAAFKSSHGVTPRWFRQT